MGVSAPYRRGEGVAHQSWTTLGPSTRQVATIPRLSQPVPAGPGRHPYILNPEKDLRESCHDLTILGGGGCRRGGGRTGERRTGPEASRSPPEFAQGESRARSASAGPVGERGRDSHP